MKDLATPLDLPAVPPPAVLPANPPEWDICLRRIRAGFREMPGLALSVQQAQRLWSLDGNLVERLFAALVASGDLRQLPDRRFVRARNDR